MSNEIKELLGKIEELRSRKLLTNEVARLVSYAVDTLNNPEHEDDAILANRLVVQGSDPLSLEILDGEVNEGTRLAHRVGPGVLKGKDKEWWLALAHISTDEATNAGVGVATRVRQFFDAFGHIYNLKNNPAQRQQAAHFMEDKIRNLPFTMEIVGGREMRVYNTDLGFAAAYWGGEDFAAVRSNQGYLMVGSRVESLKTFDIMVDKELSPTFGLVFGK
jgi:hypothetical protein